VTLGYTLAAIQSQVAEQILFVVEQAIPEKAASVRWRRHDDTTTTLDSVTEPDRLRRVEVTAQNPRIGSTAWGGLVANYDTEIRVEVGYPVGALELIAGISYRVSHLKESDVEQIDKIVELLAPFQAQDAEHPAIQNAHLVRLEGTVDGPGRRSLILRYFCNLSRDHN
jgi:hypothetical protein